MRILIDIGHPAHVHYFKNLAKYYISKGDQVLFTCRDKEVVIDLLELYDFDYRCIGHPYNRIYGKIKGLLIFNIRLIKISRRFSPDMFLSAGSIYAAYTAFFLRLPHITLEDTFNMEQVRLYMPFSSAILTGNYKHIKLGKKEISYNGFQELAYLHPKYFVPDPAIREELNLTNNEKYFIIRFVSWHASHDLGQRGLSSELKKDVLKLLIKYGKVFISSEKPLTKEFEQFKFPLSAERIHHALSFADLYVGEGATMASECGILGTSAIYINSEKSDAIDEQEKYGNVHHFLNETGVSEKIKELVNNPSLKKQSISKSKRLIEEKIDVTAFLIWFVENWPESFRIMKENPGYQERFR